MQPPATAFPAANKHTPPGPDFTRVQDVADEDVRAVGVEALSVDRQWRAYLDPNAKVFEKRMTYDKPSKYINIRKDSSVGWQVELGENKWCNAGSQESYDGMIPVARFRIGPA